MTSRLPGTKQPLGSVGVAPGGGAVLGFSLPPRPPKRRRKQRTVYSVEQQKELETFFQNERFPSYNERETLAARLNLQEQQVQVWFKNRRAKEYRLQRATSTKQPGPQAPASSRSPEVCASVPAPAPAASGPAFPDCPGSVSGTGLPEEPELPWDLLLSQDPLSSGGSELPGDSGFDDPFLGVPEGEAGASSHLQDPPGPCQDAQEPVPAAAAPAPAADPVFPEMSTDGDFWTELNVPELLSLQDPTQGPSSCTSLEI
ncbi:tetrapeptide repeat homeobox protein 2-like [Artibeus jamaicensis]|uniref:tetrapeptide repeat homeobox protein 2-like n=1 Tax=Artibeus jamaicensis TaxID=9417 RepID=UPI00235B09CA|nr:tetrapeptide repeat homeobox protein 2-like [Artibeus jamaicensis]